MRSHVTAVAPDGIAHRTPWDEPTTLCGETPAPDWRRGVIGPVTCPACHACMNAAWALTGGIVEPRYPKWHRLHG